MVRSQFTKFCCPNWGTCQYSRSFSESYCAAHSLRATVRHSGTLYVAVTVYFIRRSNSLYSIRRSYSLYSIRRSNSLYSIRRSNSLYSIRRSNSLYSLRRSNSLYSIRRSNSLYSIRRSNSLYSIRPVGSNVSTVDHNINTVSCLMKRCYVFQPNYVTIYEKIKYNKVHNKMKYNSLHWI